MTQPTSAASARYRPTPPPLPPARPLPRRQPRQPKPVKAIRRPTSANRPVRQAGATAGKLPIRRELSAGGVAARQDNGQWVVALLQTEHKRGKVWVLPKGHVELHTGENISEAARREVQEEAGLRELSVRNQLGVTKFKFQVEDAVVYKTVHYFLMITNQKELTPQQEEGMLDAAWWPIDEAIKKLEYDTDQDIVSRARDRLLGPQARRARPPGGRQLRIHT